MKHIAVLKCQKASINYEKIDFAKYFLHKTLKKNGILT